jgi:CheY-like chemotaxis protein
VVRPDLWLVHAGEEQHRARNSNARDVLDRRTLALNIAQDSSLRPKILCVDDDPSILRIRKFILEAQGYQVAVAQSGLEALLQFEEIQPNLVVLDFAMPGMNGAVVAAEIRRRRPSIPLVLLTAYLDLPEEIVSHFDVYVTKGENPEVLLEHICRLLARAAVA